MFYLQKLITDALAGLEDFLENTGTGAVEQLEELWEQLAQSEYRPLSHGQFEVIHQ